MSWSVVGRTCASFRASKYLFSSPWYMKPRCHVSDSHGIACSPIACTAASAINGLTSLTCEPNPPTCQEIWQKEEWATYQQDCR
jgi:hypothetical protein